MKIPKCGLSVREIVVLVVIVEAGVIAILDTSFRWAFFGLAEAVVVGYFAQMFPEAKPETKGGE